MGAGIRPEPIVTDDEAEFQEWKRQQALRSNTADYGRLGNKVAGFVGNLVKGAPFGDWLDDATAATIGFIEDPRNPLKNFEKYRQHLDQPAQDFAAEHPVYAGGAQVATAVATGAGAQRLGQAVVGKGAARAASALHKAMPTLTPKQKALQAGATVAGSVAEGAVSAAGAESGGAAKRLGAAKSAAKLTGGIGAVAATVGGVSGAAKGSKFAKQAENVAPRPKGDESNVLGRALRAAGIRSHDDLAAGDFLVALERAGLSLDEFVAAAKDAPAELVYDIGGKPFLRMARMARTVPSEGATKIDDVIDGRRAVRGQQVESAVEDAFGGKRENPILAAKQLKAEQVAKAKPLYEEAYQFGVISDPAVRQEIEDLYNADPKLFRRIFEQADRSVKFDPEDGRPLLSPFRTIKGMGGKDVETIGDLDVRTLDALKKGLDAVAEAGIDADNKLTKAQSRGLRKRLNRILDRVDEVVVTPDGRKPYQEARRTWQDDAIAQDALEEGQRFGRAGADEVEALWPDLPPNAQQQYLKGATSGVTETVQRAKNDPDLASRLLTPNEVRKYDVVIPDQSPVLQRRLGRLQRQRANDLFIAGGSQTFDKSQDAADGGVNALVETGNAAMGGATSFVSNLAKGALTSRAAGNAEHRVNALSKMLVTPTEQVDPLVRALQEAMERERYRQAQKGVLARSASRVFGGGDSAP